MDIHKPKPWHDWREFLKEIGTIVIGVLIALAGEQAVEAGRHREIVARGEDALADNFGRFVEYTAQIEQEAPCMAARAAELRTILDRAGETRRLPAIAAIPQPYPLPWQIDTWEAMVASGAAPYLPQAKTVLYSRIAMSGVDLYNAATNEWTEWGALRSLSGPARGFSETEEARARDTLARAVEQAGRVRFIAEHTVERIQGTRLLDQKAFDQAAWRGRHPSHPVTMCQAIAADER
ncbi:hypothetical protein [Phenylobacterium sp.]|uniref:hypothetical protein n=1 Tax=Phenylobacterium sp. TaxID=1871053 RepID=UPI002DE93A25|nr:hypothetical protein [Phenylobacterium sp.]